MKSPSNPSSPFPPPVVGNGADEEQRSIRTYVEENEEKGEKWRSAVFPPPQNCLPLLSLPNAQGTHILLFFLSPFFPWRRRRRRPPLHSLSSPHQAPSESRETANHSPLHLPLLRTSPSFGLSSFLYPFGSDRSSPLFLSLPSFATARREERSLSLPLPSLPPLLSLALPFLPLLETKAPSSSSLSSSLA